MVSKPASLALTARARRRVVASLAGVLLVLYKLFKWKYRTPRGCPWRTPRHWLLGNLPELLKAMRSHQQHELMVRWHEEHGDTLVSSIPLLPFVIDTTDPKNVEHILKTRFDNYIKGNWFRDRLTELLGDGIFNVDGALWHSQRKTSSQMFTQHQFETHIWRVVERNTSKVVDILQGTPQGTPLDVFNLMNRFTLDTIGEVGFAKDIGSLKNPASPFLKSFDRAQQVCMYRFVLPWWKLFRFFKLGDEGDAVAHFTALDAYARETVRELKERVDKDSEAADSFVGLFVKQAKDNSSQPYDEDFMRDMVLNFLIAGRDTTAHGLSWLLYLVMCNPEVERKILNEIETTLGDRPLAYKNLKEMKYVQAVINESLRLYPSVPVDSKEAVADDTLPDGTWVPKGTVVQFNPYAMARSEKIWGKDAAKFRPERWMGTNAKKPGAYEYPVFNAGPRECLGKRLAWVEMKALVVAVVRSVKLTLAVAPEDIHTDTQLTIGMSSGLPCKVEARK